MIDRFSIQGGFPIKRLGELAVFLDHKRQPITAKDRTEGPYPYYGANGQQDSVGGYIFDEPLILVAEDGGHFDNPDRGIAYRIQGKSWVNNHAHVLRPKPDVDLPYLCRVLENYDVRPYISGTTRAKLTKGQAEKIEIPLPPLSEQRRIAGILDQADALRRLRRQSLARLSDLGQAIFYEMFESDDEFRWPVVPLAQVSRRITDGEHLTPKRCAVGFKLLSARNVRDGYVDYSNVDYVDEQEFERIAKRCRPKVGDVLISCSGSVGRVALIESNEPIVLVRSAALVIPDTDQVDPRYLSECLRTQTMFRLMTKRANSSGQPNLFLNQIRELPINLPPLSRQKEFSRRFVLSQSSLAPSLTGSNDSLLSLFTSLQHRAFRGEL